MSWFTLMPSAAHSSASTLARAETPDRMIPDNTRRGDGWRTTGPVMNSTALPRPRWRRPAKAASMAERRVSR